MIEIGEVVLLAVIIITVLDRAWERRRVEKREQDLLNRLMSRDFPEYALGTKALGTSVKDELKKMELAKEEESIDMGFPIDH